MPPPRKIDQLPADTRQWLQDELMARGFGDYENLARDLNVLLEEQDLDITIGKSAIHNYAQDFKSYGEAQKQAQEEIRTFLQEASLQDEVDVTSALFQQLVAIQWKLQMMLANPDMLPDPRGMKDLTSALNNLIRSTSLRDDILKSLQAQQSKTLEKAVDAGDIDKELA